MSAKVSDKLGLLVQQDVVLLELEETLIEKNLRSTSSLCR